MKSFFLLFFIILHISAVAQTSQNITVILPSIALLDIAPNNTAFNLNLVAPTDAGNIVVNNNTNATKWINFTSAVATGITRKITAQISGTLPNGLNLKLITLNYAGAGAGTLGTSSGTVYLTGTAQTVVNNIGGAYTGDGSNNGYNLNYSLEISNYSLLRSQTNTFSIIYTMSDN
jgi:hypothetical protein